MCAAAEAGIRLIEADVAVAADAENLQVNRAVILQHPVICQTFGCKIRRIAVRHMSTGQVDIDMVEQMLVHEAAVALRMVFRQAHIFIEIIRGCFGKADQPFAVHLDQSGIDSDRRAAGSKTEYGSGIALQQTDDQISTGFREIFLVLECKDVH
ncbi:hypothetical protein D3C80_1376170 [compost metagenome]